MGCTTHRRRRVRQPGRDAPPLPPSRPAGRKLEQMRQGLAQDDLDGERALRLLEEQARQERGLR